VANNNPGESREDDRTTFADQMPWVAVIFMWLAIAGAITALAAFTPPSFADKGLVVTVVAALVWGAIGTMHIAKSE
jgi:hypothetical protein